LVVLLLPYMQASRILLLAAALAILCSVTNAQYTITDGNAGNLWKCDKTKVANIANKEAQAQCLGFCNRVDKTVADLEVEFFLSSAFVRVCARVVSSFALLHLHRKHARRQLLSSSHSTISLALSRHSPTRTLTQVSDKNLGKDDQKKLCLQTATSLWQVR